MIIRGGRKESIVFKWMPNGNIRAYRSNRKDKAGAGELMITNPKNEGPSVIQAYEPKVIVWIES